MTRRLRTLIQEIGFALGGKGGERLSSTLGIPTSDTTVLWSLSRVTLPLIEQVRVVGVDDWSWRRGQRYGSLLVDLETHTIIDLLPERTVESVVTWLEGHPEVEIVSRDRGGTYVDGATQGAPLAIQVCDRWHLLKNLGDAVEAFLLRTHVRLDEKPQAEPVSLEAELPLSSFSATKASQGKSQARLFQKWNVYQKVQKLHAEGMSLHMIAETLDLARNTVRKCVRQPPEPPLSTPRPLRASQLDRYEEYLLKRWSDGCRNAALLYREIQEQGYQGANTLVRAYIAHLRTSTADGSMPRSRKQRAASVSPRELRWLLARKHEEKRMRCVRNGTSNYAPGWKRLRRAELPN